MLARLEADGVRVVTIADVADFDGVRSQIEAVAEGVGVPGRGAALIARMDETLAATAPPVGTARPSALYLSAGGFTAGRGTLMDAILEAAGYSNAAARPFFTAVSVERIALFPPARFVLGFFDQPRGDWRGAGRHPVVRDAARGRIAARLPAAALTCPAWFAADAAAMLRAGA
ncbi:ABC transporter substrate-binding protein, partial [Falsiroseomonas sp.]|uniref:ABC transporter substrate-binding protein n=1 Tax=Falsiroseomonas sp. TaxID=2870721 RepID=UPI00272811E8